MFSDSSLIIVYLKKIYFDEFVCTEYLLLTVISLDI